jgi:hypothetical protein
VPSTTASLYGLRVGYSATLMFLVWMLTWSALKPPPWFCWSWLAAWPHMKSISNWARMVARPSEKLGEYAITGIQRCST